MESGDGKRASSDVPSLDEAPAAKRPKLSVQRTAAEIEALRRRAEGLDEKENADSGDEGPSERGQRGNRNAEAARPAEEDQDDEKEPGPKAPKHNYVLLFGYLGVAYQGLQRCVVLR